MNDMADWRGEHFIRSIRPAPSVGAITYYDLKDAERDGLTTKETAERHDVRHSTVMSACRRYGIELRRERGRKAA